MFPVETLTLKATFNCTTQFVLPNFTDINEGANWKPSLVLADYLLCCVSPCAQ